MTSTTPSAPLQQHPIDLLALEDELTERERAWRDGVRDLVTRAIRPNAARWFADAVFPADLVPELGARGAARRAPQRLRMRGPLRRRVRARRDGARGRRLGHPHARVGAGLARDDRDPPLRQSRRRRSAGCRRWPPARRSAASASPSPRPAPTPRACAPRPPDARRRLVAHRLEALDRPRLGGRGRRHLGAHRGRGARLPRADGDARLHRDADRAEALDARVGAVRHRARRRAAAARRAPAGGARTRCRAALPQRGPLRHRLGRDGRRPRRAEVALAYAKQREQFGSPDRGVPAHPAEARRHAARDREGRAARAPPRPAEGRRRASRRSRCRSAS